MIIAVDADGGEYAPHEVVKGAIKAAQEYGVDIALVGDKAMLHVLTGRYLKKLNLSIVKATEIIEYNEPPMKAVRSKPDSAIVLGINMVRDGTASAFVSAGSTGAVICAALLNLGKMENVERPALCSTVSIVPSPTPALLVDAGANADCRPSHLVEFARLGNIYSKQVIGIESPRIGLLNNGEEETKGNRLAQETYELLKKTDLNFIGNIEGHDIARRKADVIVTDGFTGNIVLKTIEGLGDTFSSSMRELGRVLSIVSQFQGRTLLREIGLSTKRMDYREYGGASLLGVKGNVVVAHGRSQSKAIKNAIGLAKRAAERNFLTILKEESHG